MKKVTIFSALLLLLVVRVIAQNPIHAVKDHIHEQSNTIIEEFSAFLSIPNLASDAINMQKNADFIRDMMHRRGIQHIQLLEAASASVPPVVYGDVIVPGAKQTIIFYAHYDGQPVNPAQWAPGLTPFTPKLFSAALDKNGIPMEKPADKIYQPEWRIYARGASDDKGGVTAILNAYGAMVAKNLKPTYNLKFFFEGEEEAGSTHLQEILIKYKALLQSDLWIICDGPVHQSGKKQIVFGVRGDTHLDLTVYASKRPLHSGHYGNWAPNPALMLSTLLSSMKDDHGRVLVKGFYDDVIPFTASEKNALKNVPSVDEQMKKELGISAIEMPGTPLNEAINLPSLNINGMQSGNVGKMASNQIPTFATAVIDLRLVLGNDWKKQQFKVMDHIRNQGYSIIDHNPTDEERMNHTKIIKILRDTDSYNAQRTSMDLPIARQVIDAVQMTTKDQVVLQPTLGGSLPLYVFEKYLNAKTITVPIANHDNNQHAENENIRLANLYDGIETMAAIMMMK
jgi:acetylornithine deacetylase/succinyl-diaminopimelate desuccinylase-like protein